MSGASALDAHIDRLEATKRSALIERDEARRMATEAAEMLARITLVAERSTIRASLLCSADELAKRIAHRSLDEGWVTFDDVVDSDG